jgi:c-di-GMP-binding flagellar brake protein YcgR
MCQNSKTVNASKFVKLEKKLKIKVKCSCGHSFTSFLERRKHYRKEINLNGTFVRFVSGKAVSRGNMVVMDLSLTGMKLKVFGNQKFLKSDILKVEFRLNDVKKTRIKKKVIIRNNNNSCIGTLFLKNEIEDTSLGFYLF